MGKSCNITSQTEESYYSYVYFTTPTIGVFEGLYFSISAMHSRTLETTYDVAISLCESTDSNVIETQNISITVPFESRLSFNIEGSFSTDKLKPNTSYILKIYPRTDAGSNKYVYLNDISNHVILAHVVGPICIDNGTEYEEYQCYIDTGSAFELYTPYIDNGTSWEQL